MRADVSLRGAAYVAAPLALAAGWRAARRVADRHRATVMHGHWVIRRLMAARRTVAPPSSCPHDRMRFGCSRHAAARRRVDCHRQR